MLLCLFRTPRQSTLEKFATKHAKIQVKLEMTRAFFEKSCHLVSSENGQLEHLRNIQENLASGTKAAAQNNLLIKDAKKRTEEINKVQNKLHSKILVFEAKAAEALHGYMLAKNTYRASVLGRDSTHWESYEYEVADSDEEVDILEVDSD